VKDFLAQPETPQGSAFFEELLWVHSRLRKDLATVRRLAEECREGRPAEELQDEIASLEANSPLWRLKIGCLHYCHFVHSHHTAEDMMLFPRLRIANPELNPVIDKLEADHKEVADLLRKIEATAQALTGSDSDAARERLSGELDSLGDHLLAHLDYEEKNLEPSLRRIERL
jgi:cell division septum initiation protein DivIVA